MNILIGVASKASCLVAIIYIFPHSYTASRSPAPALCRSDVMKTAGVIRDQTKTDTTREMVGTTGEMVGTMREMVGTISEDGEDHW